MYGSARTPSARSLNAASSVGSVIAGSGRSARSRSSYGGGNFSRPGEDVPIITARSTASTERSYIPQAISTMSARSERSFFPSSGEIGLAQHSEEINHEAQIGNSAGMHSAAVTYHGSGYCMPRFERQKLRAMQDETIVSGERQVDPGIFQRIPTMHQPLPPESSRMYPPESSRYQPVPESARIQSARTECSDMRTARSSSSCGSWLQQTEGSVVRYKTNNAAYGSHPQPFDQGGFQPGFGNGREVWQQGRFRGKNSSDFQNCLVDNNRYVPFLG